MNYWKKNAAAFSSMPMARKLRSISEYDLEDALGLLGLARRRRSSTRFLTGLGLVLGGVAVGTIVGMMFAPKAGMKPGQRFPPGMRPRGQPGAQPVNVGSQGSNFS